MAEIRRGKGELSSLGDRKVTEPESMELPVVATCDGERPAKKRVIAAEYEKNAGRAKSEIREMLSFPSESVKQLNEMVSHLQCSMLIIEKWYHQRFCKIQSFLGKAAMVPRPLQATASNGENMGAFEIVSATIHHQPQDDEEN
ncbi:hypothetical protein MRX96_004346 [Rhipicephalus microplus]